MAAFKDGLDAPTITALASLANWGQHESNVERDFHRLIPCLYGSSFPTYDIAIDIYDPDAAAIKTIEVPVLLASTVLHELHKKDDKTLWSTCIGATAQKTYDFWTVFNTDRASQWSHPVFEQSGINQWFFNHNFSFCPITVFWWDALTSIEKSSLDASHLRQHLEASTIPAAWCVFSKNVNGVQTNGFSHPSFQTFPYLSFLTILQISGKMVHWWGGVQHKPRDVDMVVV